MVGRAPGVRIDLKERLTRKEPRKLLAIDGGGIRGVLSLQILAEIERVLIAKSGRNNYRLADYFDYVAGTSTGGIIAAGIAVGMSVRDILDFYLNNGAAMFDKAGILRRLQYQYNSEPLAVQLQQVFGKTTTLGAPELETLLLLVMRNATTDSPWPISNNPYAKYNDAAHRACNLNFPLWQFLLRGLQVRLPAGSPMFHTGLFRHIGYGAEIVLAQWSWSPTSRERQPPD